MKYYPGFNRFDLFDDFFSDATTKTANVLKTDIHEKDGYYVLSMEAPGVKKEDVTAELKDGYLTIHATSNQNKDEKDEDGKYIRRERYSGSCNRSFYVGDAITEEDIKANFENCTLKMTIPKQRLYQRRNSFPLKDNFTAKLYTSFRFVTPSL